MPPIRGAVDREWFKLLVGCFGNHCGTKSLCRLFFLMRWGTSLPSSRSFAHSGPEIDAPNSTTSILWPAGPKGGRKAVPKAQEAAKKAIKQKGQFAFDTLSDTYLKHAVLGVTLLERQQTQCTCELKKGK